MNDGGRPLTPVERRALAGFAARWEAEGLDPRRFDAVAGDPVAAWLRTRAPATDGGSTSADPSDASDAVITPDVAAAIAMGVLMTSARAPGRRRAPAGWVEPMELARVPAPALARHLVRRARHALARPFRRGDRRGAGGTTA